MRGITFLQSTDLPQILKPGLEVELDVVGVVPAVISTFLVDIHQGLFAAMCLKIVNEQDLVIYHHVSFSHFISLHG